MKKLLLLIVLFLCSVTMFSQENDTATVYFFRKTGTDAIVSNFRVFIDNTLVCKLKNKKYSIHQVKSGKHVFSVQLNSTTEKKGSDKFEIDIEAGKTYYMEVKLTGDIMYGAIFEEVTENTAKKLMPKLKQQDDCLK